MESIETAVAKAVEATLPGGGSSFAILSAKGDPDHYVQWSRSPDDIQVEVSDAESRGGAALSAPQQETLRDLGFAPGDPNFEQQLDVDSAPAALTKLVIASLTGVLGVQDAEEIKVELGTVDWGD